MCREGHETLPDKAEDSTLLWRSGGEKWLIFVPLCSVLYALFRTFVYKRLKARNITPDKWALNPPHAARGEPIKVNTEKLQKLKEHKAKANAAADEAQESIADVIEDGRDTPEE